MPAASDDEIRVPAAAKLLALESRTVRELIERGVLHAEVTYGHDCSKLRRSFTSHAATSTTFSSGPELKAGDLRHLHPTGPG